MLGAISPRYAGKKSRSKLRKMVVRFARVGLIRGERWKAWYMGHRLAKTRLRGILFLMVRLQDGFGREKNCARQGARGNDLSRTFYGEGERPPRNRNANRSRLCSSFHSSVRILSNKDRDGADHCPAHRFACPQFHRTSFSVISRLFLDRMMFAKRF